MDAMTKQEYLAKARQAAHNAEVWRDDAKVNFDIWQLAVPDTARALASHKQMSHARQMMAAEAALAGAYALLACSDEPAA